MQTAKQNYELDHVLFIESEKLSDGSEVFDIVLYGETKFHAITRDDAEELALKIKEAINAHSVGTAGVIFES